MSNMRDTLGRFPEQFSWEPEVENNDVLRPYPHYHVVGMGGSHLGIWMLKKYGKVTNLTIQRDYGIPSLPENTLVILSSYSGTTEEVLDAGREALAHGYAIAAISTGGKLIEFAKEHALPYVLIPDMHLQPRLAIGLSMLGVARLIKNTELESAIRSAGRAIDPFATEIEGSHIAREIQDKVPLVYSSHDNVPLAYMLKIKLNETAKIPAFCNTFPELCHNEMNGFDIVESTRELSRRFHVLMIEDPQDHPRTQARMRIAAEMFMERGIPVEHIVLTGTGFTKAFSVALLADWITLDLAAHYGVPDEEVPLVEEFKRRLA